jgi:hypothetical protein
VRVQGEVVDEENLTNRSSSHQSLRTGCGSGGHPSARCPSYGFLITQMLVQCTITLLDGISDCAVRDSAYEQGKSKDNSSANISLEEPWNSV